MTNNPTNRNIIQKAQYLNGKRNKNRGKKQKKKLGPIKSEADMKETIKSQVSGKL